jgi:hypothetical protein
MFLWGARDFRICAADLVPSIVPLGQTVVYSRNDHHN